MVIYAWEALINWYQENIFLLIPPVILCGVLAGFILGWIKRGSADKYVGKSPAKRDDAFFKGFQYILSNDHDHAIEEFTKSVKVNSDTVETYVALGNLFRTRGDIERAVRIRQSIILRTNIEETIRIRALFDLGLDYRKGGLINRALSVFLEVARRDPANVETLIEIEKIYEELKDWENAYRTRQKIARMSKGEHNHILAHHQVEMGKIIQEEGDLNLAKSLFEKAVSIHKGCVDAYLHLGDLYLKKQEYKKAVSAWKQVIHLAPEFAFLSYRRLEGAYSKIKHVLPIKDVLIESVAPKNDPFVQMALARFYFDEGEPDAARNHVESVLEHNPTFWEARRLKGEILLADGDQQEILEEYKELLSHLTMPDIRFQCSLCGFQPRQLQWQCLQCRTWDSIRIIESSNFEARNRTLPDSHPVMTGREQGDGSY
jgi:lipopolysaccharide biosynthesis regulator YciM